MRASTPTPSVQTEQTIPIIDFGAFYGGDEATRRAIARQIYDACHTVGFMVLCNHGLAQTSIQGLFEQSRAFFNLPLATKQRVSRSATTNCGYIGVAGEKLNTQRPGDLKEAFNVGLDTHWPEEVPDFQPTVSAFYDTCIATLARSLFRAFALALELPEQYFEDKHGEMFFLRLLHYPPLPETVSDRQIRAGEHTDYGSFTLLFQDGNSGLEVKPRGGDWIAVPSIPGTVVVNIGDAMQRWTNDRLQSTPHRVVNPDEEGKGRSRYSAAMFCDPNREVWLRCLDTCQGPEDPPRYDPIQAGEFLESRLNPTYR